MNSQVTGTIVEDFLNPKSMPTPALAGAMVAMIAGALFKGFGINVATCSLLLSFIIGLILFHSKEFRSIEMTKISKAAFYIVNSLIIFAMATGATSVLAEEIINQERPFFNDWTKKNDVNVPEIDPSTSPFRISVNVTPEETGEFRTKFQSIGLVQPEYRAFVSIDAEDKGLLNEIERVKFKLPEEYFANPKINLEDNNSRDGIQIKVWKSFEINAEIETKSGEKYLLNEAVILDDKKLIE